MPSSRTIRRLRPRQGALSQLDLRRREERPHGGVQVHAWPGGRTGRDADGGSAPRGRQIAARGRRLLLVGFLLLVYGLAPLALLSGPKEADNHSIGTLSDRANRAGRAVAFDRAPILHRDGRIMLKAPDGEVLLLEGPALPAVGKASLRGRFRDADSVVVEAYHEHWGVARDYPTLLALVLIAVLWAKALWLQRRRKT